MCREIMKLILNVQIVCALIRSTRFNENYGGEYVDKQILDSSGNECKEEDGLCASTEIVITQPISLKSSESTDYTDSMENTDSTDTDTSYSKKKKCKCSCDKCHNPQPCCGTMCQQCFTQPNILLIPYPLPIVFTRITDDTITTITPPSTLVEETTTDEIKTTIEGITTDEITKIIEETTTDEITTTIEELTTTETTTELITTMTEEQTTTPPLTTTETRTEEITATEVPTTIEKKLTESTAHITQASTLPTVNVMSITHIPVPPSLIDFSKPLIVRTTAESTKPLNSSTYYTPFYTDFEGKPCPKFSKCSEKRDRKRFLETIKLMPTLPLRGGRRNVGRYAAETTTERVPKFGLVKIPEPIAARLVSQYENSEYHQDSDTRNV